MFLVIGFIIKAGFTERRGQGVNSFLVARDRYIDDVLLDSLNKGLQQLVILGAGFDSRPYRFDLISRVKTFEVDHPATQTDKLAKLQDIFGKVPEHVSYVPTNFNTQTLEVGLMLSGYDPNLQTLFIWQGVRLYWISDGVETTLAFIVRHSGADIAVVFDYVYRSVLEETQKHPEIINMRRYRFMTGEGLTFGIPESAVNAFMKERGFQQTFDINADYLKTTYFTGKNAVRAAAGGYGIVIGKI